MELDDAYVHIQSVFSAGLVTIVGSGASAAFGLPSMSALATHLLRTVKPRVGKMPADCQAAWATVSAALTAGRGLEEALSTQDFPPALSDVIAFEVAECVGEGERQALAALMEDPSLIPYGQLASYLLRTSTVADIITTNYDRLIEVSTVMGGHRVDTMFYGHTAGRLDARLARDELLVPVARNGKSASVRLDHRPHIRISKPHGSLDWYLVKGEVLRSELPISGAPQIVAPGSEKYRRGYDVPFDAQRERANIAIDKAAAILTVGYGFNDDHLQTHLASKFSNVPALVLARTLTENARTYLKQSDKALGIERDSATSGAVITLGANTLSTPTPLWDLKVLMKEVLGQ